MRSPFCEASIVTHFLKVNRGQGIGAGEERAGPLNQMNNYCKTYEDRGQLPTISFLLPKNVLLDPSRILYLPMICQSDANLMPICIHTMHGLRQFSMEFPGDRSHVLFRASSSSIWT